MGLKKWYTFSGYSAQCDKCGAHLDIYEHKPQLDTSKIIYEDEKIIIFLCPCGHEQQEELDTADKDIE